MAFKVDIAHLWLRLELVVEVEDVELVRVIEESEVEYSSDMGST